LKLSVAQVDVIRSKMKLVYGLSPTEQQAKVEALRMLPESPSGKVEAALNIHTNTVLALVLEQLQALK
jgi:hypothetical protein